MTETTVEIKTEEHKEPQKEASRERFDFRKWVRGSSQKEFIENISYLIIFISAVMVSAGIGLGSFVQGTVLIAVVGAFLVMIGIVAYIASQFIGG